MVRGLCVPPALCVSVPVDGCQSSLLDEQRRSTCACVSLRCVCPAWSFPCRRAVCSRCPKRDKCHSAKGHSTQQHAAKHCPQQQSNTAPSTALSASVSDSPGDAAADCRSICSRGHDTRARSARPHSATAADEGAGQRRTTQQLFHRTDTTTPLKQLRRTCSPHLSLDCHSMVCKLCGGPILASAAPPTFALRISALAGGRPLLGQQRSTICERRQPHKRTRTLTRKEDDRNDNRRPHSPQIATATVAAATSPSSTLWSALHAAPGRGWRPLQHWRERSAPSGLGRIS